MKQYLLLCALALVCSAYVEDCNTVNDCTQSINVDALVGMNTGSSCWTMTCTNKKCGIESQTKPSYSDYCKYAVCKKMSSIKWQWVTQTVTCASDDECYTRKCNSRTGICDATDICSVQSTECTTYSCRNVSGVNKCISTAASLKDYECAQEVCNNGKKTIVMKDLSVACPVQDKCKVASCSSSTYRCVYSAKQAPGNDPCRKYSCDPSTGTWTNSPKCDDGDPCTEDVCSAWGDCRYVPIDCAAELNMTGYDCFTAQCVANGDKYACKRKMIPGSVVDICGRCTSSGETHEELEGQTNKCYDVSCVSAPVLEMSEKASDWTKHTNDCMQYICDNETGLLRWSLCNNTPDNNVACVNNKCVAKDTMATKAGWVVEVNIDGIELLDFNETLFLNNLSAIIKSSPENLELGMEFNNKSLVSHIDIFVKDESEAKKIEEEMKKMESDTACEYGLLCSSRNVTTERIEQKSTSQSEDASLDVATSVFEKTASIVLAIALFALALAY